MNLHFLVQREEQLSAITQKLAPTLASQQIIFVEGEMGSGKTTFTRHLIKTLSDINEVNFHFQGSPTYQRENHYHLSGQLIEQPQVSTGGGDNFNAGFCFGLLNDFSVEESMILAMATSGAYVQNGNSPDQKSLMKYLSDWQSKL